MVGGSDTPEAALLVDPQTEGGLVAAGDPGGAERVLARLTVLGHPAAIIGSLTDTPNKIEVQ